MAIVLSLGGVVFTGFEVPETINFGGEQKLAIHKLPGGGRIIDSMGPDDADIRWSGRLRGPSGEQRGILLDYMRRRGRKVLLTWGLHRYQVVIRSFEANFQNLYEIPYSIACTVVIDEAQALASAAVGFAESIAADFVAATGLSEMIGSAAISEAVGVVGTAFSNYKAGVPSATNLITAAVAPTEGALLGGLLTSITGAQGVVGSAITSAGNGLNLTPPAAGASPSGIAAGLQGQAAGFGQLNNLHRLSSTLGRMAVNTTNAGR